MKALTTLILLLWGFSCTLHAGALPETTLKAAYLYNFALLTDWPEKNGTGVFALGFYRDALGGASDALNGKTIRGRTLKAYVVSDFEGARQCQMVFIREPEAQSGKELIRRLEGTPVLIVTENPNLADSHITVRHAGGKLVFDISLRNLSGTGLELSSRLLKLARKVDP